MVTWRRVMKFPHTHIPSATFVPEVGSITVPTAPNGPESEPCCEHVNVSGLVALFEIEATMQGPLMGASPTPPEIRTCEPTATVSPSPLIEVTVTVNT